MKKKRQDTKCFGWNPHVDDLSPVRSTLKAKIRFMKRSIDLGATKIEVLISNAVWIDQRLLLLTRHLLLPLFLAHKNIRLPQNKTSAEVGCIL